uniref:cytochrome P450 4C1-like n=1 Tax=Pieris napi TaxID=78633 RepID=UPI00213B29FC
MFLSVYFILGILCVLHILFNYNKTAKMMRKIPGFRFNFIVGNALEILVSPEELFAKARVWASQFQGIYGFYVYPNSCINIYNAEDAKIVLSSFKYHQKSMIYTLLRPWLQNGLLVSKGAQWQERRKILTPTFHFNILKRYYPAMVDSTARLLEVLDKTNEKSTDIPPVISEFTLTTICETAMGTKLNEDAGGKMYKDAIHDIKNVLFQRFVYIPLAIDFIFRLTPLYKRHTKSLSTIHNFTQNVIKNRKEKLKDISETNVVNDETDKDLHYGKIRTAFLDFLISAQKDGLTDDVGIQEEVDTFMFEGHDTVSSAITFCLLLLAENKAIQNRVVDELQTIFIGDTRTATLEDISSMHYLECCIKESMRLYPPVPFISRKLPEAVTLSNYVVPKGSMCHIHIFDLHRQESLFENSLKFDPDRFLPENSVGRHPYAYIAFSAGPRNCIGQKFAMMEMKLVLSSILRRFELNPVTKCEDLKFTADIILKNSEPIKMKFIRRLGMKIGSKFDDV